MKHPARTIRALAEEMPEARPFLDRRDPERQALIEAVGRRAFAELGPNSFTMTQFAKALWMSLATFNRHYCDLESLLAHLIRLHLNDLSNAIAAIPPDAPDRHAARRAAYLEATRTGLGGLTNAHILLVHARRSLPPALRAPIEDLRDSLGEALAGEHADAVFPLLDAPELCPAEIELSLAGIIAYRDSHHAALMARHAQPEPAAAAPAPDLPPAQHPAPPSQLAPPVSLSPPKPPPPAHLTLTRSVADMHNPKWLKPQPHREPPPRRSGRRPLDDLPEAESVAEMLARIVQEEKELGGACRPPQTPRRQ